MMPSGFLYLHWIQTRYILSCLLLFTCSRLSIKFCFSSRPEAWNMHRSSSAKRKNKNLHLLNVAKQSRKSLVRELSQHAKQKLSPLKESYAFVVLIFNTVIEKEEKKVEFIICLCISAANQSYGMTGIQMPACNIRRYLVWRSILLFHRLVHRNSLTSNGLKTNVNLSLARHRAECTSYNV